MSDTSDAANGIHPLDDDEFQGSVRNLVTDAIKYIDEDIAPYRVELTRQYRGDPYGNEQDGRSQVIMTEIRDVVNQMLPHLLRTFCGSEKALEIVARTEEDCAQAQEMTDTLNWLLLEIGDGFNTLHAAFKDALIRRTGILHAHYEEERMARRFEKRDMTKPALDQWEAENPDCEILEIIEQEDEDDPTPIEADPIYPVQQNPKGADMPPPVMPQLPGVTPETMAIIAQHAKLYTVSYKQFVKKKHVKLRCLPQESYFINRDAPCPDEAVVQGVRFRATVSELVAMGHNLHDILENMGSTPMGVSPSNMEALARNPAGESANRQDTTQDKALHRVLYTEAYVRVDADGDGIAEMWRVCMVGTAYTIIHKEIFEEEEPNFFLLCPDPEPHVSAIGGYAIADHVADLQLIKSAMVRDMLDSLKASIFPTRGYVEGSVNPDDLENPEIGHLVRMRTPGAIQEFTTTFAGPQILPVLAYLDDVSQKRTGLTDGSAGLNGDELQSTTAVAVSAQINAAQQRLEMICRIFGESLKKAYMAMLRLCIRHFDKPINIRRRDGSYTLVDPRKWDPSVIDCVVNVGLGRGNDQQRAATFGQVLQIQQTLLSQMGLDQPLVGPAELRNTLAALLESGGVQQVTKFFKNVDPNWKPQPPQQQQQDPTQMIAQLTAQTELLKATVQREQMGLTHQQAMSKQQSDDDFRREQLIQQRELAIYEMNLKYGAQLNSQQIQAQQAAEQREHDANMQILSSHADAAMQAQDQNHDAQQAEMARQQQASQQQAQMAQQAALAAQKAQMAPAGPMAPQNPQGGL